MILLADSEGPDWTAQMLKPEDTFLNGAACKYYLFIFHFSMVKGRIRIQKSFIYIVLYIHNNNYLFVLF